MASVDVIIIGSGPAGAHAAYPVVEAGLDVMMVDAGREEPSILSQAPGEDFELARRANPDQWKWFLGEDFSSIPLSGLKGGLGGGMASGNRSYVTRDTERFLPLEQDNVQIIQSLAKGGLGAAWGATSAFLDDAELKAMGFSAAEMKRHYEAVTARIGVSSPESREGVQPALKLDHHALAIVEASRKRQKALDGLQVRVTQPASAVLTQPLRDRQPYGYDDLNYYGDPGKSLYRPQYSVDELKSYRNFRYAPGYIVEKFERIKTGYKVHVKRMDNNARESFDCKRVILAAGAVGSARIALRSLDLYGQPVPILLKPHLFIPCLHPRMLGKAGPAKRSSLCQLIMVDAKRSTSGFEGFCAQLYSYRSLLLFRLLGSVPLPAPEAMAMLSILSPALLIADVRFPLQHAHGATLSLERNGWTDKVHIQHPAQSLKKEYSAEITRLKKALRATGVYPLKTMELPEGSTSHYAGSIPMNGSGVLACDGYGRLRGEEGVYIADASVFPKLTAKPHTLTIMAYANRTGELVAEDCRNG